MLKKTSNLTFKPNQLLDVRSCAAIKGGRRNKRNKNKNNSSSNSSSSNGNSAVAGYYCCTRNQFIEY